MGLLTFFVCGVGAAGSASSTPVKRARGAKAKKEE